MTSWTTTELLADIRDVGRIPSADPTYTSSAILRFSDRVINEAFTTTLLGISENFGAKTHTFSITADDNSYRIPTRAYGDILLHAEFVDQNGTARRLNHYHLSQRHTLNDETGGQPEGLVVEGNEIILVPTPQSSVGQLRIKYMHRPGKFIQTSDAMQITGISGKTLSGNPPTIWTTANTVDLVQEKPGFDTYAVEQGLDGILPSTSILLTNDPPDDLAVGDWVSLTWQTPIIQVPLELHGPLVDMVAGRIRSAIGDTEAGGRLMAQAEAGLRRIVSAYTPRVKGISRKVSNQQSFLRGRRPWARRWDTAT